MSKYSASKESIHLRLVLFEVMCHNQSELTRRAEQLGFKAIRFSIINGRQQLFHKLRVHRPKHVWYSCECRLWCQWGHLNKKSLTLHEKITNSCWENLWQITFGIVLHQIQVSHHRHFHIERPLGSTMLKVPGTQSITEQSRRCCYDMCKMGDLQDPQPKEFIRKRMIMITTPPELYHGLRGKLCSSQHDDKQIAGSSLIQGRPMALSK